MTSLTTAAGMSAGEKTTSASPTGGRMSDGRRRSWVAIVTMALLTVLWTLPTVGLLVTSLRSRDAQAETGWWTDV